MSHAPTTDQECLLELDSSPTESVSSLHADELAASEHCLPLPISYTFAIDRECWLEFGSSPRACLIEVRDPQ